MVNKWTSIRVVLKNLSDIIDPSRWNELEMLDHAAAAMEKIGVSPQFEEAIYLTKVENHKAQLPSGLVLINQIAYKHDGTLTESDIDEIKKYVGIDNDNYYNGFLGSSYYQRCYYPLRLANSSFASHFHMNDEYHLNVNSEHTYSVHPNGTITTSFKEGYIIISYLKYPQDECGDFLIPDNADFVDALFSYCMYKHFEREWAMNKEGAERRMQYYQEKWRTLRPAVVGDLLEPSIDDLEDMRQMRNRLVPKERRYYSFFGNLATAEQLNMKGEFVFHNYGDNNHI